MSVEAVAILADALRGSAELIMYGLIAVGAGILFSRD